MHHFDLKEGVLNAEGVSLETIADEVGTPVYVYSTATLKRHYGLLRAAADAHRDALGEALIAFAVKANSNLSVLATLARLGSGADTVSEGEIRRALAAGVPAERIIFSGVGKTDVELAFAIGVGVRQINIESGAELDRLIQIAAAMDASPAIAVRVNPNIGAGGHAKITTGGKGDKFGVPVEEALALYARASASPHVTPVGLACHIGSQITELEPFDEAFGRLADLVRRLRARGHGITHVDLGGGLGVQYRDEQPPLAGDYITAVRKRLAGRELSLVFEPGRFIVANAGVLLTQVEYLKHTEHKDFAIVDAAMNDLIRPALYQAWMNVIAVQPHEGDTRRYDIVGPICETGDFLAKDRELALAEGDLLAVCSAGAYGFVMSSNYNTRGRAAEVLVDGDQAFEVRRRESVQELYAGESLLPT